MAVPRNLRYSPFNWLIIDWGFGGRAFDECGLPEPAPCDEDPETEEQCKPFPIQEAIDTYDWERWLPEVIVGIEDPDEEIAANYVRAAAIEFCKGGRVLQRELIVELQPDINVYPVFPYPEEQIIGVIGVKMGGHSPCGCHDDSCCGIVGDIEWRLDTARNELTVNTCNGCGLKHGLLRLLVWAAPTEDACVHDKFLYDRFRNDITLGARNMYAIAVHFRDRLLMASLPSGDTFQRAIVLAKNKAVNLPSSSQTRFGSGMWDGGCCYPRYDGTQRVLWRR